MSEAAKELTALILDHRVSFLAQNGVASYYKVNCGLCIEFAEEVFERFKHRDETGVVYTEDFFDEYEKLDWKELESRWGIKVPQGMTKTDMESVYLGGHAFLAFEGRWYDAECPAGVESFLDLPLFRRPIVAALRTKGIPTPDVETDDVVAPPPCRVENPVIPARRVRLDDDPSP